MFKEIVVRASPACFTTWWLSNLLYSVLRCYGTINLALLLCTCASERGSCISEVFLNWVQDWRVLDLGLLRVRQNHSGGHVSKTVLIKMLLIGRLFCFILFIYFGMKDQKFYTFSAFFCLYLWIVNTGINDRRPFCANFNIWDENWYSWTSKLHLCLSSLNDIDFTFNIFLLQCGKFRLKIRLLIFFILLLFWLFPQLFS